MTTTAALVLAALGCQGSPAPAPPQPAPPASPSPAPTPPAAAPPAENTVRVSWAAYEHEQLSECVEMEVRLPAGRDPEPIRAAITPAPTDGVSVLPRPCSQQFADRLVLASCTTTTNTPTKTGATITHVTRRSWYTGAVMANDREMRECMGAGGTWDAADRRRPEVEAARLQHQVDELQRRHGRR